MICPQCQKENTKVIDSRESDGWKTIRRRRECESCKFRFTTFEKPIFSDLMVNKKDNSKEIYDRDKLKKSISLAFAKRKISNDELDALINDLEIKRIQNWQIINSETIWKDVLRFLKEKDPVAYTRFASVYMDFNDLDDFRKIL